MALKLSAQFSNVHLVHLTQKGRGRALRHAWMQSKADVVCYMDVDLSTDLSFLPKLIGAVAHEGYGVATGSRLMRGSRVKRSLSREIISRIYNLFLKAVLFTRFSDAQCGFKAVSRKVVDRIVPQIVDQSWFFDTELLTLAEKQGYRVKDIPISWIEDDDSRRARRISKARKPTWSCKQTWLAVLGAAFISSPKRATISYRTPDLKL